MSRFKPPSTTGLAITNPLILYRTLLATKTIEADPAQHRLALHLQKLYFRLKDYAPADDYSDRLDNIRKSFGKSVLQKEDSPLATKSHPLRRNPLLAHLFMPKEERSQRALIKVLTSQEAALHVQSPKGLLLYGEVGTGKSMLVDLLADSLPNPKKQRWHFNTFMLETLARLESFREARPIDSSDGSEYSLLLLAKDMIEKSPILFLDEFQLPDRAASKILSNLFTIFFQLGGVLIATSNRMPEELSKASGVEFTPPPKSYAGKWFAGLQTPVFAGHSEFAGFLNLLKARCEIWDMEGDKDWRRRDIRLPEVSKSAAHDAERITEESEKYSTFESTSSEEKGADDTNSDLPAFFVVLNGKEVSDEWNSKVNNSVSSFKTEPSWQSGKLSVYGRTIHVPRHCGGVTRWTFQELCEGVFGPADYITLASTFHTLILEDVPVLTVLQKNEARRMITLLDALYEARCKLIVSAHAGPDDIFFPEASPSRSSMKEGNTNDHDDDATYAETIAEIYQDQTLPFRPNVSYYKEGESSEFDLAEDNSKVDGDAVAQAEHKLNFGMTSAFTGEDERFAYKRARSRLWEMCGSRWHARSDPGWWRPLSMEVRQWERPATSITPKHQQDTSVRGDVQLGPSIELEEPAGLQGKYTKERRKGM